MDQNRPLLLELDGVPSALGWLPVPGLPLGHWPLPTDPGWPSPDRNWLLPDVGLPPALG